MITAEKKVPVQTDAVFASKAGIRGV